MVDGSGNVPKMEWSSTPEINPQLGIMLDPQTGVLRGSVATTYQVKRSKLIESEGVRINQKLITKNRAAKYMDSNRESGLYHDDLVRLRRTRVSSEYIEVPIMYLPPVTILIRCRTPENVVSTIITFRVELKGREYHENGSNNRKMLEPHIFLPSEIPHWPELSPQLKLPLRVQFDALKIFASKPHEPTPKLARLYSQRVVATGWNRRLTDYGEIPEAPQKMIKSGGLQLSRRSIGSNNELWKASMRTALSGSKTNDEDQRSLLNDESQNAEFDLHVQRMREKASIYKKRRSVYIGE